MAVKRKKDDDEKEEAKELVTDMDVVKEAIQTCLDFEKEKRIRLINPRGKRQFTEMYQRDEPKRKMEQIIDSRIDSRLERQIGPLKKNIDILLVLVKEADAPKTKKKPIDIDEDDIDVMKKKIDEL